MEANAERQHYSLQLPTNLLVELYPHDVVEVKRGPKTEHLLFVRKNRMLLIHEAHTPDGWSEVHRVTDFFSVSQQRPNYPWAVYDEGLVVVRTILGVELYRWSDHRLTFQFRAAKYNDIAGYGATNSTFLMGKIYPSEKYLGVVTRVDSGVEFRSIDTTRPEHRLRSLKENPALGPAWSNGSGIISLVENVDDNRTQQSIALRTGSALQLFRFDSDYLLQELATISDFPSLDTVYDRILFAKFNSTRYNDLLHFTTEGLTMYRYNETLPAYQKVHYSTAFSRLRGWNRRTIGTIATLDVDGDRRDELIYTGPNGLTVMRATAGELGFDFGNILHELSGNQSIHYGLTKLNLRTEGKLEIFLHTAEGLTCAEVTRYTREPNRPDGKLATQQRSTEEAETEAATDKVIPEIVANRYYIRWLHDQLDLTSLLQPLNPHTGAVELTLPLIDLRTPFAVPVRKMIQYKNIDYSNELGRGWSFSLDYIEHDRYGSAFVQDHVYSLVKDNQRIILTRVHHEKQQDTANTSAEGEGERFAIDGYPDVKIMFVSKRNQWLVTVDKRTLTFIVIERFMEQPVCSTWPLCGSQSVKNKRQPSRWYLNRETDSAGWYANYFYRLVKNGTDIRLETIDLHDESSVSFEYEQDRISRLQIGTVKYNQLVRFHYNTRGDRLLALTQDDRPLFEFDYDQRGRLSKIVYPNGVEWTPAYAELPIDPSSLKKHIDIHHEGTIFYGPDYMVVVDANMVDGLITLHMRDPLGGTGAGAGKTDATETIHALEDIRRYLVHALADLLLVTIIYDTGKEVVVLQYTEADGWQERANFDEVPLEGTVTTGNTFALLADLKTLRLLSIADGRLTTSVVRDRLPTDFVVHAFPHGYATYDGSLKIFLLQDDGHWVTLHGKREANYFTELERFLGSFELKPDLRASMRRGLLADMLRSYRQTIVLKVPFMRESVLDIMVRFFTLDFTGTPRISEYYTVMVPYANMNTFQYSVSTVEKDRFVLGYRLQQRQYQLYVKESSGPHRAALDKHMARSRSMRGRLGRRQYADLLKRTAKEIDTEYGRIHGSVTNAIVFAIDLSLFGLLTNRDGVLTGSHLITCDGTRWSMQRLHEDTLRLRKVNQTLGEQYRLVKVDAHDTFKVVRHQTGTLVFDALTSKPEELQLIMPHYAQAQPKGKPLRVHFFGSNQMVAVFPDEEKLNSGSNQMAIVTTIPANGTIPQSMVFRCVKYFHNPSVTVLAGQSLKRPGEATLTTAYHYDVRDLQLSVDGTLFQRIIVAPGADRARFGWYEQRVDLRTGDTTRGAFAADGQPVVDRQLRDQEQKRRQSEEQPEGRASDLDKMIMDRGQRVPIVDLGPYRLVDEMVSYYGFEPYEANHFGKENRWVFNETLIRRGENNNRFLQLAHQMDTLTGEFMPLEPDQRFVVSCWMRTERATRVGDHLDTLTVDVLVDRAEGKRMTSRPVEVKQRIGGWSYVETILDTTDLPPATKLIFVVIVAPSSTHPQLDVDHIRFSPLGLPFEANIYEPTTGALQAVLGGDGLLKRYLHDPRGKKSVLLSGHGDVLEFTMETKRMYTRATAGAKKPCVIEMKPRRSRFNRFDRPNTLWNTTGLGWVEAKGSASFIAPGKEASIGRTFDEPWTSLALRLLYSIGSANVRLKLVWQSKEFHLPCGTPSVSQPGCAAIPIHGEILVFITDVRLSIWVEGVLLQETLLSEDVPAPHRRAFRLHSTGIFAISEVIEMYDCRMKVTYHNLCGQPTQLLVYEDPQTVRVREIRYDDIERPILQTKWTKINRERMDGFFGFYDDFITGFDNATLVLNGTVATLNPACDGYPYTYTVYGSDPTENKRMQGLPGKSYGIRGKYKREYSSAPSNVLLDSLYPTADGFSQRTTIHPGGAIRVTVEDTRGNTVASYGKVGNYDDRLSTFRYGDKNNKLEQELPPMYHHIVGTASMVDFFGDQKAESLEFQKQWEVRYDYDQANRVTRKRTPDGGTLHYRYDRYGILRFSLHKDAANGTLDRVIHFAYAANGKITREALVNLTEAECSTLLDGNKVPESTNFIETVHGEQDDDPDVRYRSKLASRRIDDDQMTEYLLYDERDQLTRKTFVVNTINTSYSIDYEYENDKLRSIRYPIGEGAQPYRFVYGYNGHGEVTSIREFTMAEPLFEYTYNADGMVVTAKVRTATDHHVQRNFSYNEPGFLVKLEDDFLTEDVSYVETDSYGQDTYTPIYEGLISRTAFTAHWQRSASALRSGIYPEDFLAAGMTQKQAAVCFDELKAKRLLTEGNQVNGTFYGERYDDLPFACGEPLPMNQLSAVLSSGSIPYQYGHRYDYDDHDQLIKAKYFHGLDELRLAPLTPRTFAKELAGVEESDSKQIWDALHAEGFLSLDCTNPNLCHGRPGTKSMFDQFIHQHRYRHHLQTMFSKAVADQKGLSGDAFDARCKRWIVGSNVLKTVCRDIKASLVKRKFIGDRPESPLASLSDAFKAALKSFGSRIPEIVRVLGDHFATALGRSAGDVQSYEIDANGNHRKFYTGFSRYRLEYRDGTNQITKLHRQYFDRGQLGEEHFSMEHNSDGAVVKAEHKGIRHMEYDRILHRVTKIDMLDGRKLLFQYDVRAERTFKQVLNRDGTVSSEKYYIRDAHGLVLVDMEMVYLAKDQPPDVRVTSYIYKDQQLVGFVRNDQLYAVIADHEGSARLVVRDGEVVAAYDYLPYGQIFRRYGTDLDGQLSYLYTGQEWEPETGLYNYRARLYDPDIGRFYQMDPKEQYPSPYVYAGNSPVALVDPDGEFAFAIACIIMAIIGAYIGASSAANSWNPLQWNWKSKSLWLGLFGGALTGLSIPFNITASVGYFVGLGLSLTTSIAIMVCSGVTFGYFALAAASESWDPTKFDFTSPGTWNALLGGIATSAFIVTTPNSLLTTFRSITTTLGRALFVTAHVGLSVTFAYLFAAVKLGGEFDVTKWDFKNPALYYSLFDGVTTASFAVIIARNLPKDIQKWNRKIEASLDRLAETEIFYRARRLMHGSWSAKLSNALQFLAANAEGIARLQRGLLPIAFYSFILSLRMAESFQSSPVPGFSVFMQIINTVITTRGFSNRVVKPLIPRYKNAPLALRLEGSPSLEGSTHPYASSGSSTLGGGFLTNIRLPLDWLLSSTAQTPRGATHDSTSEQNDMENTNHTTHRPKTSNTGAIENCYRLTDEENDGYFVRCYSHHSLTTIFPKPAALLESFDTYRSCLPLTHHGMASISCDGERSSLLSGHVQTPTVFDHIDGWLLLARITPAALREGSRLLKTFFQRRPSLEARAERELHRNSMTAQLLRLQTFSEESIGVGCEMGWVRPMLDDVREDVCEYLSHGRGSAAVLFERLEAMTSDIEDEMDLYRTERYYQHSQANIPSFTLHPAGGAISCEDKVVHRNSTLSSDLILALTPRK